MADLEIGTAIRPFRNISHCGDRIAYWREEKRTTLCVVDGLGHGIFAQRAAEAAIEYVGDHLSLPLPELFAGCDAEIRATRGVAMGISVIDEQASTLTYAGVGNTRLIIARKETNGPAEQREVHCLMSDYGIVGGGYSKLTPETLPLFQGDWVLMFTDGIRELIDLWSYDEGLLSDAQGLAGRILEDWGRITDDAAVLVLRR
ncbi:MAG: hypothetical protein DRH11_18565 [Deltaproteobacteria bacterium]|nr:MAG: hypothetical protein DRH11_18565 [Deltaproteobacteria bacterium]